MFGPGFIIGVIFLYIGLLFVVGQGVERRVGRGRHPASNPLIYSLSLAIYCTSWTYYGSVGNAATSGFFFLTIYLGPTLVIILWWSVLRKLVRLKNQYRITSIADFIAARYGKSQRLAALATCIALVGSVPYIALQLKAVIATFAIITAGSNPASAWIGGHVGPIVVLLMITFTIVFGVRRLDPTERHEGMVAVVAVESLVKLITFLAAGIFVTYWVFDGFTDIFEHLRATPELMVYDRSGSIPPVTWASHILLSMSAILFLPRQFHIAVVENPEENNIRTAMWLFPLYMFLINLFVYPIAKGGLLVGLPVGEADTFVLRMPLAFDQAWLALLVFIGGFSAATSMIMISSMTLATMCTNHLLLPFVEVATELSFLRRHLLGARWVAVGLVILSGYWFEQLVGDAYTLVSMGIISFAAALQFAPAILGGIFWRRGNKRGAMLGLSAGFLVWAYTLILPSLATAGWFPPTILAQGPLGLNFLIPQQLFGLSVLDPVTHSVFWSLLFNIGLYVMGSLCGTESAEERHTAEIFVGSLLPASSGDRPAGQQERIVLAVKRKIFIDLLLQYFSAGESAFLVDRALQETGLDGREKISVVELADLAESVEKGLAGVIGSAAAHAALKRNLLFTPAEIAVLQEAYSAILASLPLTPDELKKKIDYYREREVLVSSHAAELEEKLVLLEEQIRQRQRSEEALRESEERLQAIMDNTSAMISLKDIQGHYILVNRQFEKIVGLVDREIMGRTDTDLFPPEVARTMQESDRRVLVENELLQTEEAIPLADGVHSYLVVKFPLYDELNEIYCICTIATDITALRRTKDQLRRLSGSIMTKQEQERSALARELHDELGQALTALRMDSVWLRRRMEAADAKAAERADSMSRLIDNTIDEVRTMSIRLRPSVLDDLGLIDALEWLAQDFENRSETSCLFRHGEIPELEEKIATTAYRITQEALTNVARHAGASEVRVSLNCSDGLLELRIRDNGRGFDTDRMDQVEGLGLAGMRERASLLGGKVEIVSFPRQGTEVVFRVKVKG